MGCVDCGKDDPVGEKAAGNVEEVCPASTELVAFDFEILGETVVNFVGGIGSWVLSSSVEPEPWAHDLVPGLLGHAQVPWPVHIREPYILEVFVSESHGVEPNVEMKKENAIYFGGAFVGRCIEYKLHGVTKGLVCSKGLLEGVVGKVNMMLVGSETGHADMDLSEEGCVAHYRRYPFRAISIDSDESHAILER